jgi:predicted MFS family arabinose efflux permease
VFGLALAGLLVPLTLGRQTGWPAWSLGCLAAVVPLFVVFAVQQRARVAKNAVPLIAPRLFADRSFTLGLLINVAFYAELGSFFLVVTWFLQEGLGLSPLTAGLTFASLGCGFVVGSFVIGRRYGGRYANQLLSYGVTLVLITVIAGTVLIGIKGTTTTPLETVPVLMLVGLGNGLVLPTTLNVVLGGVAKDLAGAASGVLVTMQQVGTALGAAGVGAIFFAQLGSAPSAEKYKTAMATTLVVDSGLVLLTGALIATLLASRARDRRAAA